MRTLSVKTLSFSGSEVDVCAHRSVRSRAPSQRRGVRTANPPRATSPAPAKDALNQEDKRFVQEAAAGGMAEVELSKIAQKSENPDIKRFADRMVQDHMAANQELMSVTGGLGIDVPRALDHEHE